MRIDDAGPRTWLLAGTAGWALLVWLLAFAGMGGRVEPLSDDADLLRPLPQVRPAPDLRPGPAGAYVEIGNRPLLAVDRRPRPFFLQGQGDAAEPRAFEYTLTGVLISPGLRLAILQPADGSDSVRVTLGEAPAAQADWRLAELAPRSAVFEGPDGRRTLELRVFDGTGGASPTVISEPRAPETAGPTGVPVQGVGALRPTPPSVPAPTAVPPPRTNGQPAPPAAAPMTDQAQMEAIRRRIQERRESLRGNPPANPPAQNP